VLAYHSSAIVGVLLLRTQC